jgi:hypothetical protein
VKIAHYSLIPVDSAPLPPHERTWRHPSEMGAPVVEVEPSSSARVMALVGGTLAVALVAALVITLTPRQTTTTTAISVTTVPAASALQEAANTAVAAAESIRTTRLSGATAIPNAIADVPSAAFRSLPSDGSTEDRAVLPDLEDQVTVLTEQFAYSVAWRDVGRLDLAEIAIVVDDEGTIVARIDDGRLIVSHDLLVGASISVD